MNRITPPPSIPASQLLYGYNIGLQNALTHQPVAAHKISPPVPVREAFLLVSQKLISKVESGAFVDMAEVLSDRLGNTRVNLSDEQGSSRPKKRSVTSILKWIQCFSIYTSIISKKQPERVPDLLGYQFLIIDAYLEYRGDTWVGYDRKFRLTAAANATKVWARIDPTLWNLAFTKTSRCTHCFRFPMIVNGHQILQLLLHSQYYNLLVSSTNAAFALSGTVLLVHAQYLAAPLIMYIFTVVITLLCATKLTRAYIAPSIQAQCVNENIATKATETCYNTAITFLRILTAIMIIHHKFCTHAHILYVVQSLIFSDWHTEMIPV